MLEFGKILRELRGTKSQGQVARDLGITKSSWAMYERNQRVPRDEVKVRISKYFNKPIEEIFFRECEHI